jgi:dual specificity phosphatase 12
VSVLRYNFEKESAKVWQKYRHCIVQVDDVEDENLLCEFARTGAFIKEALEGGGRVLVHW